MSAVIINGKTVSDQIRHEISVEAAELIKKGIIPGLGFILVGDDPAAQTYVRMKGRACEQVKFKSFTERLPATTSQTELLDWVNKYNSDDRIHGFLVQLPLPGDLDETEVINTIDQNKDVDCFHPYNVGILHTGKEVFAPCTPAGIIELLLRSGYDPAGKNIAIIGRSSIVGRPLATLLSRKGRGGNATVTLCHSHTKDIPSILNRADIVVAAIGRPEFIYGEDLKPGCVVIDVGVNRVTVPVDVDKRGYKLVGDVHFESASRVAAAITPVPGGVGPMTITMLLKNTIQAARRKAGIP